MHILLIVGLLWLVPTIGLFLTSLLSAEDYLEGGWWQIFSEPSKFTLENYSAIFHNETIMSSLVTTIWIAIGGTLLPIDQRSPGTRSPGSSSCRDWLFIVVIALLVVPLQMALIPMFRFYETLHINDTIWALILFHTAFGLPFAIFLLRNFFIGIPRRPARSGASTAPRRSASSCA